MKIKLISISTITILFFTFFVMPAMCFDPNKPITLDAKDNDIRDILTGLARANTANLVMGTSVTGKITISLSNVPFMKALELITKSSGYVIEIINDTIVVAKPEEINALIPKSSKSIILKYASANDVKQALAWISTKEGIEIIADQRTNSIFITGPERSFQKVDEIVKLLDIPVSEKQQITPTYITRIFTLKYGSAVSLQKVITDLCSPSGKVAIDERTNSLIVTEQSSVLDKIAEIITQLDFQTEKEKQALSQQPPPVVLLTQVFKLNYIEAEAAKEAVQAVLSSSGKVQTFVRRKDIVVVEARESSSGRGGGGQGQSGGDSGSLKNFYKEKWSDTLIVTDTAEVMERVSAIIAELDKKPVQLRIEAKIVEVNLDNKSDLGISWGATHKPSGSTAEGYFPADIADKSLDIKIGTLSTEFFENIKINLNALESTGKAKLLSNPSVIAIDNELAQMIVADKIPIITTYESQFSATTQVEFINIGVMLNVVPHVTEEGDIIMDAMPVVDSIKQWTGEGNSQPIISSRVANCRVKIKDGETLALGGLIKDEQYKNSDRIPILGRLPLIGRLFGSTQDSKFKTDLVIFITPKIIKD